MLTLKREYDRLKTFNNLAIDDRKAHKFAKSGFFYTNLKDFVKCYFCSLVLSFTNSPSDIDAEHLRLSPQCMYASGVDVCGLYDTVPAHRTSKIVRTSLNLLKVLVPVIITIGMFWMFHNLHTSRKYRA